MTVKTEVPSPKPQPRRHFPPQLTAWLVLVLCFGLFCLIAYLILTTAIDYFSHSVQPQKATLLAANNSEVNVLHKGQDRFLLISQNQLESVTEGDVIRTAQGNEARLNLFDGTILELASNTEVVLTEHQIRVNNFVQKEKRIIFQVRRGILKAKILPMQDYNRSLIKATMLDGAEVLLNDYTRGNYPEGTFTLELEGNNANRAWVSSLRSNPRPVDVRSGGQVQALLPGERVTIERGVPPVVQSGNRELVNNGAFIDGFDYWRVQHDQGGDGGSIEGRILPDSEIIDDGTITRTHILRYESKGNFEETSLRQDLNADVRDYAALVFKFKGRVRLQSLPGGGQAGNEYPLFMKINYTDRDGQVREFFRGFYFKAADANTRTYDRLSNELLGSQQWRDNKWEQFEIDLSQLKQKPAFINYIIVGSAGHDYETYFTEVSLIARLRNL